MLGQISARSSVLVQSDLVGVGSAVALRHKRPHVAGKFIWAGSRKLHVRGVTYGTFELDENGSEILDPTTVDRDFAMMAANGINSVRTYTPPPRWLLDAAGRHGLYVLVGLVWDQYTAFLDNPGYSDGIVQQVRQSVRSCAGHHAVLGYTIGNEIPSSVVRWYGHQRIARFLKRLYQAVKDEDPKALVTYVNYPSTEYLELPFLDFICFNVYLESQDRLEAYLARLQNLSGDRPLILAEIGLDSQRNGEDAQAQALDWQIRTAYASGAAGVYVFAWTDEWFRTTWIDDWDFGLTDRQRQPKAALASVRQAFDEIPFPADFDWPRVSVVVCTYNGSRTIVDCLEGLSRINYPNFEVIVVDDGSRDNTADIVGKFDVRLIRTPNMGLSNARNLGLDAATGEIIAYLDDDARPDPDWLTYLAATFARTEHAGVGGPNITPPGDGPIAECVANAPGNPVHVLLTDDVAEHIPGCNMAFRTECLRAIGGFDPQFRVAGDDVDVCWRIQEAGWTLGFSPAAMVWHHRRNSIRAFLRQQRGYGKAEAMLERKWPGKYNGAGTLRWSGKLYGRGLTQALQWRRGRIYQGEWGNGLFQSLYQPSPTGLAAMLLMPEWYLVVLALGGFAFLGAFWQPLLWVGAPLFVVTTGAVLVQSYKSSTRADFPDYAGHRRQRISMRLLTWMLHLLQPMARLAGHISGGLTPWRQHSSEMLRFVRPLPRSISIWCETWQSPEQRVQSVELAARAGNAAVARSGDFRKDAGDRWDLEIGNGLLGTVRTLTLVEEHGMGRQQIRFRTWPRVSLLAMSSVVFLSVLAIGAAWDQAWIAAALLGAFATLLIVRTVVECSTAMATVISAIERLRGEWE